jgi:predicted transcriptional regulator
MVHWSIRGIQVRSRELNEKLIKYLNEAHVIFVTLTEIRDGVRTKRYTEEEAKRYLDNAIAAEERVKLECEKLIIERAKLLETFISG